MAAEPRSKLKLLAWLVAFGAVVLLLLQFVRPKLENPPASADLQAPPEVKQILKTACYNCHSNESNLSWFDWPVPAYWLVVRDIRQPAPV